MFLVIASIIWLFRQLADAKPGPGQGHEPVAAGSPDYPAELACALPADSSAMGCARV